MKHVILCLLLFTIIGCSAATATIEPSALPAAQMSPPSATRTTAAQISPSPSATPSATATITATASPTVAPSPTAEPETLNAAWSYPMGVPGRPLGDGFWVRDGFQVENTWYNPGYWHTAEDWYALEGDTAGTNVYAAAAGEVVYAGSNYPGRVVIVRHGDNLYSMYGHLDPALSVQQGQTVERGALIGTVLDRSDDTPNHLHFEIRTFVTANPVNGDQPRYNFRCGVNCVPGPGYWPIDAPDLPSAVGWRNPTHAINRRAYDFRADAIGEVVVATQPAAPRLTLYAAIAGDGTPEQPQGEIALETGARFALLDIWAGSETVQQTSARSYAVWYNVRLADGRTGWLAALAASDTETGSDGRPSAVRFNLLPAIAAP